MFREESIETETIMYKDQETLTEIHVPDPLPSTQAGDPSKDVALSDLNQWRVKQTIKYGFQKRPDVEQKSFSSLFEFE